MCTPTQTAEEKDEVIKLDRDIKTATSLAERGELKTKRRSPGELTQSLLSGGPRAENSK